jgi:tRNA wybutosine-synthesizing protein 1
VAISLAGEPTLYPKLSEFIDLLTRRGMTSFLVSNGTRPDVLARLTEPTQLYITLAAPDQATYEQLCRPIISDGWSRLVQSQELLRSMSCRTVNRLTMVSGHNMRRPRSFADLILAGEPEFVEVKGYMFLGSSRMRMGMDNAPSHREIRAFAEKLSALTGYYLQDEQVESRVVLLSRSRQIRKIQ